MNDKRTTYCYVPDGLDKLELARLKARIKTYYPEVILLLVNDLGDFRGRFPSGLLNDSFKEKCRIVLDTTYQDIKLAKKK